MKPWHYLFLFISIQSFIIPAALADFDMETTINIDNITVLTGGNTTEEIIAVFDGNTTLTDTYNSSYEYWTNTSLAWYDNTTIFASASDTNASTKCTGDQVLNGDNQCVDLLLWWNYTYNITYDLYDMGNSSIQIIDVFDGNTTLTDTYNSTYDIYDMGNTSAQIQTVVNAMGFDVDTNASTKCAGDQVLNGDNQCVSLLLWWNYTYNVTYDIYDMGNTTIQIIDVFDGNTTLTDTYNSSYEYWTNQTIDTNTSSFDYFVNITGDTMTGNLNMSNKNITNVSYGFFDFVSIGTTDIIDTLTIVGDFDLIHTSIEADDHALEIDVDASGFGDVKGIDLFYDTGTISLGDDEAPILITIDESDALGGDVFAVEVLSTEGSANIYGLKAGALVGPIHQDSGTFASMDSANNSGVNDLTNFTSSASDSLIFVNDDDYIIIGDSDKFEELEILLNTTASNPGIKPTFAFSTGAEAWTSFTPVDGTDGMRHTGIIAWEDDDIPAWAAVGGEYLINITRTQNSLSTVPREDKIQIAAVTEYVWNELGDVEIRNLNVSRINATDWTNVSITESQISDLVHTTDTANSSAEILAIAVERADWTSIDNYPSPCTSQFVSALGDTLTCDTINASFLATNLGLGWENITGRSLDIAWTGSLHWGNLTALNLDSVWTGNLYGGNITTDSLTGTQIDESSLVLQTSWFNTTIQIIDVFDGNTTLTDTYNATYDIYDQGNSSKQMHLAIDNDTYHKLSLTMNISNITNPTDCGASNYVYGKSGSDWLCRADETSTADPDTNASTKCTGDQVLNGDNQCVDLLLWWNYTYNATYDIYDMGNTSIQIIDVFDGNTTLLQTYNSTYDTYGVDTNASTKCTGDQVLNGDNQCVDLLLWWNYTYNITYDLYDMGNSSIQIIDVFDGNTTLTDTYNSTYDIYDQGNSSIQIIDVFDGNITLTDTYNVTYDTYGVDTNASTKCSGTTTYLDGENNCDDISGVYVDVTGDAMTGNLNMSTKNITTVHNITFGDGDAVIYWNGTNLIISS